MVENEVSNLDIGWDFGLHVGKDSVVHSLDLNGFEVPVFPGQHILQRVGFMSLRLRKESLTWR